jgi:excisionase family DNA binding protein
MSEFLSIEQAAPRIGVAPRTLRLMCERRKIRHTRVGAAERNYRFRPEWLDEYLAAREVAPEASQVEPAPVVRIPLIHTAMIPVDTSACVADLQRRLAKG